MKCYERNNLPWHPFLIILSYEISLSQLHSFEWNIIRREAKRHVNKNRLIKYYNDNPKP